MAMLVDVDHVGHELECLGVLRAVQDQLPPAS